jgi:hypothetical protein
MLMAPLAREGCCRPVEGFDGMLWLAGLMGIVGIGAASLVAVHEPEEEDADDLNDQGILDEAMMVAPNGNFPGQETSEVEPDPLENPLDGALHAGLLDPQDSSSTSGSEMNASGFDDAQDANAEMDQMESDEPFDFSVYEGPEYSNFMTGDWITQAKGSEIIDYLAERESIVVVWDDTDLEAREPTISVSPDPDDPEVMQVNMNGKVLADVYGDCDLSVSDLTMIPLSSALIVGLTPA